LGGLCPLKTTFFHALGQGSYNGAKILDEVVLERGQPMKAMNFRDGSLDGPTLNSFNLDSST